MGNYIQISTTFESRADAERMAELLLSKRLAACVQIIGPMTSRYWWQGRIETAEEWLCVVKSREDLYGEIESTVLSAHPYEVPELLAVPIILGNQPYLAWINRETIGEND